MDKTTTNDNQKEQELQNTSAASTNESSMTLSDDIKMLTDGEDLSEAFKEKAQVIFETAVSEKVKEIESQIQEEVNKVIQQVEEEKAAQIEESVEFVVEQVDNYLDYVVEEWLDENKLAVESSLRAEIAEDFIGSLKNVFMEHHIDVPEEKVSVVDDLSEKVLQMKREINALHEKNIALKEQNSVYMKNEIIDEMSSDLSLTQKEKLHSLCEDIDFVSTEQFERKVNILKGSYFKQLGEGTSGTANSSVQTLGENVDTSLDEPKAFSRMDSYVSAITNVTKPTGVSSNGLI